MSGVAGRSGRKKFVPTPYQCDVVKLLAGRGIPQEHIRRLIINPQTGKPLSIKTLELAFASEIKTAQIELNVQMVRFVVDTIFGQRPVSGRPIKSEWVRLKLAIFFLKCRAGWRESR